MNGKHACILPESRRSEAPLFFFEKYQVAYSVVSLTAKEGYRYAMMTLDRIREKKAFLIDMDGVIYHGKFLLPGVPEFISWLREEGKLYRFVTNNSYFTAAELSERLCSDGDRRKT